MLLDKKIIITSGEPSGIGPDLIVLLAQTLFPAEIIACSDPFVLLNRAKYLNLPLKLYKYDNTNKMKHRSKGELPIIEINTKSPVVPGVLDSRNSSYVINTINQACDYCINGDFNALITGPVHKGIINKAGFFFSGHTEYLRNRVNTEMSIMMLLNKFMRVAFMTTHIPISLVSSLITKTNIYKTIILLSHEMKHKFKIDNPNIYVCGLNPHAGEDGILGKEENEIIIPTLNKLRSMKYNLFGPFSADTIFQKKYLKSADVILAMYHDQGLPVVKYHGFDDVINVTLGLPFIRTSVGHGVALDLVKSKKISSSNIQKVLNYTIELINNV